MKAKVKGAKVTKRECFICKKDHDFPPKGDGTGNSLALGNNLGNRYSHNWQLKNREITAIIGIDEIINGVPFPTSTIQAHHIIPSTIIKQGISSGISWREICDEFGFDINKAENGMWLPSEMALACQLKVPLHRGGHPKGYYKSVKANVKNLFVKARRGGYCPSSHQVFVDAFEQVISYFFSRILEFEELLTSDGSDYQDGNNGCAQQTSISKKPNIECNRKHKLAVKKVPIERGKTN